MLGGQAGDGVLALLCHPEGVQAGGSGGTDVCIGVVARHEARLRFVADALAYLPVVGGVGFGCVHVLIGCDERIGEIGNAGPVEPMLHGNGREDRLCGNGDRTSGVECCLYQRPRGRLARRVHVEPGELVAVKGIEKRAKLGGAVPDARAQTPPRRPPRLSARCCVGASWRASRPATR